MVIVMVMMMMVVAMMIRSAPAMTPETPPTSPLGNCKK